MYFLGGEDEKMTDIGEWSEITKSEMNGVCKEVSIRELVSKQSILENESWGGE